jgi:hypothetical protein
MGRWKESEIPVIITPSKGYYTGKGKELAIAGKDHKENLSSLRVDNSELGLLIYCLYVSYVDSF